MEVLCFSTFSPGDQDHTSDTFNRTSLHGVALQELAIRRSHFMLARRLSQNATMFQLLCMTSYLMTHTPSSALPGMGISC